MHFALSFNDLEETVDILIREYDKTQDKSQIMGKIIYILNDKKYDQDIHWEPVNTGYRVIDEINDASKDSVKFYSNEATHTISQVIRIFIQNNLIILILAFLACLFLGG